MKRNENVYNIKEWICNSNDSKLDTNTMYAHIEQQMQETEYKCKTLKKNNNEQRLNTNIKISNTNHMYTI